MTMFPGQIRKGVTARVLTLDPVFFITLIFLDIFPLSLLSVLQQNNPSVSSKFSTIMIMGVFGLVVAIALASVKQQKIQWIGFSGLIRKNIFLVVLVLLGFTWISQYVIFAGTSVTLGITSVLQGKITYGAIGVNEELLFGVCMFISVNSLMDSPYWTAFNFILNPIIFGIYHIYVIGASVALLYVILPRIIWNVYYLFAALPTPIMITHFVWNFVVASLSVTAMSAFALAISMPQLSLLSCLPPIALILWRVFR